MPLKDPIARRAYQKQWERKQPKRVRVLTEAQRARKRELARLRPRKYNWAKSETGKAWRREQMRKWRAANPDKQKKLAKISYLRRIAKQPRYYADKILQYKAKAPEKNKQSARRSYLKHRTSRCKRAKIWRDANPDKVLQFGHARRARVRKAKTEDCSEKLAVLKRARFCHWCCVALLPGAATIDHVTPLSRGGMHCPDNLVAACLKCNTSKNARLLSEWNWEEAA